MTNDCFSCFDYFYGAESESFSFLRIPRLLMTDPQFSRLSPNAKLLYGLMLDRMGLSIRNDWYDEENRVYIYYTLDEIMEDLNCGHDKATKLLRELDTESGIGLIERIRQGLGKPTLIYVKNFLSFSAPTPASAHTHTLGPVRNFRTPVREKAAAQTAEKSHSGLRDSRIQDCGISADNYNNQNHTEKNYTDLSYTDPSILPSGREGETTREDGMDGIEQIKAQIEYSILSETYSADKLSLVVRVMDSVLNGTQQSYIINGMTISGEKVRERFRKLDFTDIQYFFDALEDTATRVKNWPGYILTALYNASETKELYYEAWVRHDQMGGDTDYGRKKPGRAYAHPAFPAS